MSDQSDMPGIVNPFGHFTVAVGYIKELFDSFVEVGFTPDQALDLTKTLVPLLAA